MVGGPVYGTVRQVVCRTCIPFIWLAIVFTGMVPCVPRILWIESFVLGSTVRLYSLDPLSFRKHCPSLRGEQVSMSVWRQTVSTVLGANFYVLHRPITLLLSNHWWPLFHILVLHHPLPKSTCTKNYLTTPNPSIVNGLGTTNGLHNCWSERNKSATRFKFKKNFFFFFF